MMLLTLRAKLEKVGSHSRGRYGAAMRKPQSGRVAAEEQDPPLVLLPQNPKARRAAALLLLALAVAGVWFFLSTRKPAGFRLLGYSFSYGRVHRIYKGDTMLAKLRQALSRHFPQIKATDEYSWPTGTNAWVFIARYTGAQPFSELSRVRAELRGPDGKVLPLRQVAFGNMLRYGAGSRDFHSIWLLQSGYTNIANFEFCLCLGTNTIPAAQKKVWHW
jgi:hypothetical protein